MMMLQLFIFALLFAGFGVFSMIRKKRVIGFMFILLGIMLGLEAGYGLPDDEDATPVAMTAGLRLYLGQRVALDVGSRIAFNDEARHSDPNAAYGLWSLGVRLSIVWRGLGRP